MISSNTSPERHKICRRTAVLMALLCCLIGIGQETPKITPEQMPPLPPSAEDSLSLGFAGMFGGVSGGAIIAAGGANFPEGPPWEGGAKVWHDSMFIFVDGAWRSADRKIPIPLAYGASVTLPNGVLFIGGENGVETSDNVFLVTFEPSSRKIAISPYPPLPEPLAYSAAIFEDGHVYVVGGTNSGRSTNSFYRLSLEEKRWEKLPDFPGSPRALHTIVVQEGPNSRKLYVIGGRDQKTGQLSVPLTNFLSYDFKEGNWKDKGNVVIEGNPTVLMGATAQAAGSMHVLVYGGSDEILFNELEGIDFRMREGRNDSLHRILIARRDSIMSDHPGFSKDILAYNTITEQWFVYDSLSDPLPVTALSLQTENGLVIVSGELSPGIRTPEVQRFGMAEAAEPFGTANYTVLACYLLLSLLIGLYFSYKQKSTDDYFVGGGRIPWWASGLSVFGTLLSAITFMAIPAKAFITDWSFFMLTVAAILVTPVIAFLFIPFFNRLKITTAYEFLENRFNYAARAFGSLSFILFQFGRIGIVLLLPSLAISIVTGIPVDISILIMGVLCILYTTFGGIEAVIWTDVLQVIVLMGGSILAVAWILIHTETPLGEMISYASQQNKFNIANMDFDFTEATFWVTMIGGLASGLVTQGTDQTVVQRYLTSTDVKNSQKTLYTNAVLSLPAAFIFFGLGTLLFIFYTEMPARLDPAISNNDSLLPWYIVTELPIGVSGLLVAGIFSAAMSSISSSLNSVSTAFCNDFYRRFRSAVPDKKLLKIARIATILTGLIGIFLALWMANSNIKSLWDEFYRYLGLFTGGLGGMFLLGMLTKKANGTGTLIGLIASALLIWYISVFTEISFLMYAFFGIVSCFLFGYIFSLVFPEK